MATFVLTDAIVWMDDLDFTGYSNKLMIKAKVDLQDATTFGMGGWRSKRGGLRSVDMDLDGFHDAPPDAEAFADLGVDSKVLTVAAISAETTPSYMFLSEETEYSIFGKVGDMSPLSIKTTNTDQVGLVRGQLGKAKGNVSATGQLGSPLNLGAGAAGKFIYASFHVFTAGTTITIQVQSAPLSNFAAPTTRATIGPLTTVGATWMTRVDSTGITDPWWRFNVSAITGTFNVAGAIAVQ